jgi:ribosomal protein S21
MAVVLAPGESVDSAYRRFIKELIVNGTFKELEKNRYHVGEGKLDSDKRRQLYKTKRKRASARRKNANKRA